MPESADFPASCNPSLWLTRTRTLAITRLSPGLPTVPPRHSFILWEGGYDPDTTSGPSKPEIWGILLVEMPEKGYRFRMRIIWADSDERRRSRLQLLRLLPPPTFVHQNAVPLSPCLHLHPPGKLSQPEASASGQYPDKSIRHSPWQAPLYCRHPWPTFCTQ